MQRKNIFKAIATATAAAVGATMVAAVPLAAAASGNSTLELTKIACAADEHSFETTDFEAPSCTEAGELVERCTDCGSTITTSLQPVGHVLTSIPAVAATCEEEGSTAGEACARCGEVTKEPKETAALGHDYKTITVAATCTKDGYTAKKCTRCGETKDKKTIAKLGHKYATKWSKDKTYHYKKCTRSGCSTVKSKAKHSYKSGSKTCKTCGYKK